MSRYSAQPPIALILVTLVTSQLLGFSSAIGMISAEGSFRVENIAVNNNATLFDGNAIQTGDTAPRVYLKDGAWMHFGTETSARINGHTLEIQQGIGEIGTAPNYAVSAKTLRITPASKSSIAQVQVLNDHRVLVAALNAPVNVYNRNGLPVAIVRAGATLSFDPSAASPDKTTITGCLLTKDHKPIVVDPNTKQVSQLSGNTWSGEVGNRVTVTGDAVAGPAGIVLQNIAITRIAAGGCSAVAADVGAGTGGGGTSHTTLWIVAGVAVGGGVIGVIVATHKKTS